MRLQIVVQALAPLNVSRRKRLEDTMHDSILTKRINS
jgi:hypothetical protein